MITGLSKWIRTNYIDKRGRITAREPMEDQDAQAETRLKIKAIQAAAAV
jgi:hypothetical protein